MARTNGFVDIDTLAAWYRRIGLEVVILPGAHTRAARRYRYTGYSDGVGLLDEHHTAQGLGWTDQQSIEYMTFHAPHPVMVNLYPAKNERKVYICAAGPTYTAGSHPRWFHIPASGGNLRGWSRECPNNGVGEPWPEALQDNILDSSAVDCIFFAMTDGWDISTPTAIKAYVAAHYELTTRKIDPWGPCRWNDYRNTYWDMDRFRADLVRRIAEIRQVLFPTDPDEEDDMERFDGDVRIQHTFNPEDGKVLEHPALRDLIEAKWAVHVIDGEGLAWLTYRHADGWRGKHTTPAMWTGTGTAGHVRLPVMDGRCDVGMKGDGPYRIMFDLVGVKR